MQYSIFKKSQVLTIFILLISLSIIPLSDFSALSKEITVENQLNEIELCKISENNGTLSGYVTDPLMNPIDGALIRVYFHETYEEDYSDENGYYHVTNIPICYCMKNCTCSKEGYKTEWVLMGITENTIYDFVLYTWDIIPVLEGTQCNGWWISPITISFIFDPEEVAEIWYYYHGLHQYTEPFVVDEDSSIEIDVYWIDFEGNQSPHSTLMLEIDRIPPQTDLTVEAYKKFCKWYVKFTLTAVDDMSGMDPYLDFYLNDVLQETFTVSWPTFEFEIEWNKIYKKVKFGFGCSDNACNYVIEELDEVVGFDIESNNKASNSINQYLSNSNFIKMMEKYPLLLQFFKFRGRNA